MTDVAAIANFLERLAPVQLAADWDNVGLLVGDAGRDVQRVMTCLTITGNVVDEAVAQRCQLIVTHHPLPFRPLRRLTTETHQGRSLLRLIEAGVAVYSAHTAFDSAGQGVNQQLAKLLELTDVQPLSAAAAETMPHDQTTNASVVGIGRRGNASPGDTLGALAARAKAALGLAAVQIVGQPDRPNTRVAVACGSAGDMLSDAIAAGCDVFVTGEARFHAFLEAEASGVAMLLLGHYASERFAQEELARLIAAEFSQLKVWCSRGEHDPLSWL